VSRILPDKVESPPPPMSVDPVDFTVPARIGMFLPRNVVVEVANPVLGVLATSGVTNPLSGGEGCDKKEPVVLRRKLSCACATKWPAPPLRR